MVLLWNWTKPILPYKMVIFKQVWETLKGLPPPWPPGSKQCEIGGFQKGTTCPCTSMGCKVVGCQTFFIFQKLFFSFYVSYFHMKTVPSMNTWFFEILKVWQPVTLQPLEAHHSEPIHGVKRIHTTSDKIHFNESLSTFFDHYEYHHWSHCVSFVKLQFAQIFFKFTQK